MREKENKRPETKNPDILPLDLDDVWDDSEDDTELDAKEIKFCCDAEKRRRIEQLREERELQRELREFFDD